MNMLKINNNDNHNDNNKIKTEMRSKYVKKFII